MTLPGYPLHFAKYPKRHDRPDKMTEGTFLQALSGSVPDRIPVFIRDMTLGMDVLGIRTTDVYGERFDPKRSAECICAFQRFTGQDAVIGCTHSAAFLIDQFGGRMKYPEAGIPIPICHPLEGIKDFSGYDAEPKGMMLSALESYSIVRRKLPETSVVLNVTGPLTKAGVIAGVEYISMLIESDRDVLNDLLALCMDNLRCVVETASKDASCDAGILASATDNPDMFGIDAFRNFSLVWTKRYADVFHRHSLPVIFHPHGTFVSEDLDLSKDVLSSGCDGFHFPEGNDMQTLRQRLGGRICLLGGTDIIPTLFNGPADSIGKETQDYLSTFSGCSYVFMPSCSLHRGIPLENIGAMCDAIRAYQPDRVS